MTLFHKGYEMTLNRVQDTVVFREGEEKLTLHVSGDSFRMVAGLNKAQAKMKTLTDDTNEDEFKEVALFFAGVIFGTEQAKKLLEFYNGDPGATITVCGRYFENRLGKLIAKQQKKS